jgi:hypothetical protein
MQIRIALIPLITYTPPNDLATHNNATFAKFKTCLLIQITDDSVKKINSCVNFWLQSAPVLSKLLSLFQYKPPYCCVSNPHG